MARTKTNLTMFPSFGNLVNNFYQSKAAPARTNNLLARTAFPKVNIKENESSFVVEVEAPGMSKSDFNIDLDQNVLTILAEKKADKKEEEANFTRREFAYSAFQRSFTLPKTVDGDKIDAWYKDGVLYLSIPKKKAPKNKASKSINIS